MTGASNGLQKALARAGSSVIAIAEMQAGDLLAELTDEQKVDLSAALAPTPANPSGAAASGDGGGGTVETEPKPNDKPDDAVTANESSADFKAGHAAATTRVTTVFASEHAKGRETRAAKMLTTSMSSDEIIGLLADEPAPDASGDDPDRARVLAAISGGNADLGTEGGDPDGKANNHGWADIHADIQASRA